MKLSVTRLFDVAKAMQTKSGKELEDFISYSAQAFEQIVRALNKNISLAENTASDVVTVTCAHNETSKVSVSKPVTGVLVMKVDSQITSEGVTCLEWFVIDASQIAVKCQFKNLSKKANVKFLVIY